MPELGNEIANLFYFRSRVKAIPSNSFEFLLKLQEGGIDIRCEDIIDGSASQQRLGFVDVDGSWLAGPIVKRGEKPFMDFQETSAFITQGISFE